MKKIIYEYGWIGLVAFAVVVIMLTLRILPEPTEGSSLYDPVPDYEAILQEESMEPPEEIIRITEKYGAEYGISPELLQAICWRESRFNPNAVNGANLGIMQMNTRWQADRMRKLGLTDYFDPDQNIHCAADFLAELSEEYEIAEALAYYRWGYEEAQSTKNQGVICEYAEDVLERSRAFEIAHGKE